MIATRYSLGEHVNYPLLKKNPHATVVWEATIELYSKKPNSFGPEFEPYWIVRWGNHSALSKDGYGFIIERDYTGKDHKEQFGFSSPAEALDAFNIWKTSEEKE